jgi:branched-chain amino acid transport system ATP-binding protein
MTIDPSVLETRHLSKRFGSFAVTKDVSLGLKPGARHALIGPNGAGKSTLINQLTGVLPPTSGEVWLNGQNVTSVSVEDRVHRGLARTFQINTLFRDLTPIESVALAILQRSGATSQLFAPFRREHGAINEAIELARTIGLSEADGLRRVADLSYGRQRMVEIMLALACKPTVLLLDEPAAGIAADESAEIFDVIERLPAHVAVLFVEHDMELVFRFARRISVLVAGALFFEGSPEEVAESDEVRKVYLGEKLHG